MLSQDSPFQNMKLRDFINFLGILPSFILRRNQLMLSSVQEEVMYNLLRSLELGKAAWMDWLIDPSSLQPPELTGEWKIYESAAVMSEATLRLARAARDKSEILTEISYSPDHLWFMVEASDFMRSVSDSGFGTVLGLPYAKMFPSVLEGPKLQGKAEGLSCLRKNNKHMDDPGLKSPSNANAINNANATNIDLGLHLLSVLIQEAINADKSYAGFKEEHLDPYIDTRKWFIQKVKNTPELQHVYLLADGNLHITGKSAKLPKFQGFRPKRSRGRPPKGSNVEKY